MLFPFDLDRYANRLLAPMRTMETAILRKTGQAVSEMARLDALSDEYFAVLWALMDDLEDTVNHHRFIIENEAERIIRQANTYGREQEGISNNIGGAVVSNAAYNFRHRIRRSFEALGFNRQPFETAIATTVSEIHILRDATDEPDIERILEDILPNTVRGGAQFIDGGFAMAIDSFLRGHILQEIKQASMAVSEEHGVRTGADGYQISAHLGARPTHQEWQGIIVSKGRDTWGYEWYKERVWAGLLETNCRHSKWPIRLGTPNIYSSTQLEEFDRSIMVGGRLLRAYEVGAKMRRIERQFREAKREQIAMEATGYTERAAAIAIRQRDLILQYSELSRVSGLEMQFERLWLN